MKQARKQPKPTRWIRTEQRILFGQRADECVCMVVATKRGRSPWVLVALETTAAAIKAGVDAVLDTHSHLSLGQGETLDDINVIATNFIENWRRSSKLPPCACGPISLNAPGGSG